MSHDSEITKKLKLNDNKSLYQRSLDSDVLCVLVRHNGCTFCRETLGKLHKNLQTLKEHKFDIVVVHMGPQEDSDILRKTFSLDGVEIVADPNQQFYKALGTRRAKLKEVINPGILWNGLKSGALLKYGIGKPEADIYQLGGIFLVQKGEVSPLHQPTDSSDTYDWGPFINQLEK